MKIVLDTNILVRANPKAPPTGVARDLLLTIAEGPHTLIVSPPILAEVERVLQYPHVHKRWPLTKEAIGDYLFVLETAALLVDLPMELPAVVSDPDDDPILQTAILGRADVLCTRDEAFGHERVEAVCRKHGIRILGDVALVKELRGSSR